MSDTNQCAWKLVPSDKFVLGQEAERCGESATIRVIRPQRKKDLYLCECHLNSFIREWGLHYEVEVLCSSSCKICGKAVKAGRFCTSCLEGGQYESA